MKIKKVLVGLTAITILGSLVACGTEEADTSNSSPETSITSETPETNIKVEKEKVTEEVTEKVTTDETSTAETEATTSEPVEEETVGDIDDETSVIETSESEEEMTEEKAIELCKEAITATIRINEGHSERNLSEEDIDEFIKTSNIVLLIWSSSGEIYTEEKIRAMLNEERELLISDPNIEVPNNDYYGFKNFDNNMEWRRAEELSEEQIQEWENALKAITSEISKINASENKGMFDFENIESVWGVYTTPKETPTDSSSGMFDRSKLTFLVMKYNGEWKADLTSSILVQAYSALSTNRNSEAGMTE